MTDMLMHPIALALVAIVTVMVVALGVVRWQDKRISAESFRRK
jgi:hypothetical protein